MPAEPKTTVEYYTVVFKVERGHHEEWWRGIQPLFMTDDSPISVTCVSKADEITRLNCIEQVAERRGASWGDMIEEIRELIVHPNPSSMVEGT